MSIRIIENNQPKMPVCEMNCDIGLSPKLTKYELTKFLNSHETNVFCGKSGSGKTSLAYSFFKNPLRKVYHNIFLIQPSHSRASMNDSIFDKLPDENKYEELTMDSLEEVLERCKEDASEGYNSCIIFDDVGSSLKNADIQRLLKQIIFNRRHYHLSCYFLIQSWKSMPLMIRKLFSNIFLFKVSKREFEEIMDEVGGDLRKEYYPMIMKQVYDKPHKWLFFNQASGRMFDGFNEIIIDED